MSSCIIDLRSSTSSSFSGTISLDYLDTPDPALSRLAAYPTDVPRDIAGLAGSLHSRPLNPNGISILLINERPAHLNAIRSSRVTRPVSPHAAVIVSCNHTSKPCWFSVHLTADTTVGVQKLDHLSYVVTYRCHLRNRPAHRFKNLSSSHQRSFPALRPTFRLRPRAVPRATFTVAWVDCVPVCDLSRQSTYVPAPTL